MVKKQFLLSSLYHGILEIRMASQRKSETDFARINSLAELLHNLPGFVDRPNECDFDRVVYEIEEHKKNFKASLLPNWKTF